jgi:heat shock protein HslJ
MIVISSVERNQEVDLFSDPTRTRGRRRWQALASAAMVLALAGCSTDREAATPARTIEVPDPLADGVWLAEDIGGRAVVDQAPTTLSFTTDGRAEGSGGCNRYSGPVSVDGSAIVFGPLSATRKACVPVVLDQEQKFLIALAGARSYVLDGSILTLRDTGGRTLVRFVRTPT